MRGVIKVDLLRSRGRKDEATMPAIRKRRTNRTGVLAKRGQRYTNSKAKPYNILCGKLKSNNNQLAKALSEQKQENQQLFNQNIQLSSQLQNVTLTCNQHNAMVKGIHKNTKEMLSMLVTMTNIVSSTILWCQQLTQSTDGRSSQPSAAPRRDSSRRLSTKSPARGVVKPMVSGHTITKPTINLRRINMQRTNNVLDLSIIDEGSPNTSQTHSSSFKNANRLGYEGGHSRRMPERIPVEYDGTDDEDAANLSRQEMRLSERFSGRLSSGRNSMARKRSGNSLMTQIRSPRVSVCDVSKLLQNSHSINVRTFEGSRGSRNFSESFIGLSTTLHNSVPCTSSTDSTIVENNEPESQSVPGTIQANLKEKKILPNKRLKTSNISSSNGNSEPDPLEGPSWLHNSCVPDPLHEEDEEEEREEKDEIYAEEGEEEEEEAQKEEEQQQQDEADEQEQEDEEEERTIEIIHGKHVPRRMHLYNIQEKEKSDDESMEFTECVNPVRKQFNNSITALIAQLNELPCNIPNVATSTGNLKDPLNNPLDEDERSANITVNPSNDFVTDRRRVYATLDDDDDTIMLKLAGRTNILQSNVNRFRLPEVNCDAVPPPTYDDSEPEVTTTIQILPQTRIAPKLMDEDISERESTGACLELPRIDEATNTKKVKHFIDKQKTTKAVQFHDSCSSDSISEFEGSKKRKNSKKAKHVVNKKPNTKNKVVESNSSDGESESIKNVKNSKTAERLANNKHSSKNGVIDSSSESEAEFETIKKTNLKSRSGVHRKTKIVVKKQRTIKHSELFESDSNDSKNEVETGKKITQRTKSTEMKDPRSAKIVLQKLNDSALRGNKRAATSDQSLLDSTFDSTTKSRTFGSYTSEQDNNSIDRGHRPKRRKAPVNLKEPNLNTKLRR